MNERMSGGGVSDVADRVRFGKLEHREYGLGAPLAELTMDVPLNDGDHERPERFWLAQPVNVAEDSQKYLLLDVFGADASTQGAPQHSTDERPKLLPGEVPRNGLFVVQRPHQVGVAAGGIVLVRLDALPRRSSQRIAGELLRWEREVGHLLVLCGPAAYTVKKSVVLGKSARGLSCALRHATTRG